MSTYQPLYQASYALVMGIDDYVELPPLRAARRGARSLAESLTAYGFDVTLLTDEEVTREAVFRWLGETGHKAGPDDRVLIYFAGHGLTRGGGHYERGYLALANSRVGQWHTTLPMDDITEEAQFLPSKHLLYILDCCFGGLALEGRAVPDLPKELDYYLTRPVRYAISAGGKEVVDDDRSPDGQHSLFTYHLLNWLNDERYAPNDGIWRARELGNYLERQVARDRRTGHKPNHNYLPGSGDGDFLFKWAIGPRLPVGLQMALTSESAYLRFGAVAELIGLARQGGEMGRMAAEQLQRMAGADPDQRVREVAASYFEEVEALELSQTKQDVPFHEIKRRIDAARSKQAEAEAALKESGVMAQAPAPPQPAVPAPPPPVVEQDPVPTQRSAPVRSSTAKKPTRNQRSLLPTVLGAGAVICLAVTGAAAYFGPRLLNNRVASVPSPEPTDVLTGENTPLPGGSDAAALQVSGSTVLAPLLRDISASYPEAVEVNAIGTGGGIQALCDGELDIAMAARPINNAELAACGANGITVENFEIAQQALAVITHPAQAPQCLSSGTLTYIFNADSAVFHWYDIPGWQDTDLVNFYFSTNSEINDFFGTLLVTFGGTDRLRGDVTYLGSEAEAVQATANDQNSLSLVNLPLAAISEADGQVLRVPYLDDFSGLCIPADRTHVLNGTYPLRRTLYLYFDAGNGPAFAFADFAAEQVYTLDDNGDGLIFTGESGYVLF